MADGVYVQLPTQQTTDKEELSVCPFDPVHRISAKRYVYHIHKCKKNHPNVEIATCPFNARHIVPKPEIRHHTSTCPDRKHIEIELHHLDTLELPNDHLAVSNEVLDFDDDEDWDTEIANNGPQQVIDPFISKYTGNDFSGNGKKVNSRREAIKKMKETLRQKMLENGEGDLPLRRPHLVPQAQGNPPVFSQSCTPAAGNPWRSQPVRNGFVNGFQQTSTLPPTSSKPKVRLAPNFNVKPKPPPAFGRGRHLSAHMDQNVSPKLASSGNDMKSLSFNGPDSGPHFNFSSAAKNTDWGLEHRQKKHRNGGAFRPNY